MAKVREAILQGAERKFAFRHSDKWYENKDERPLKMGPTHRPETSVRNYPASCVITQKNAVLMHEKSCYVIELRV